MLLTATGAALTLRPQLWFTDHPTEYIDAGSGQRLPKPVAATPFSPDAWSDEVGDGKMTELRFEHDPGLRPGDHIQLDMRVIDRVPSVP